MKVYNHRRHGRDRLGGHPQIRSTKVTGRSIYARRRDESLIGDILDGVDIELGDITDAARLAEVAAETTRSRTSCTAAGYVSAPSAANVAMGIQVNVMGTDQRARNSAKNLGVKRVDLHQRKGRLRTVPRRGFGYRRCTNGSTEDHPKTPARIYDCAKLMAENTCMYYHTAFGLDVAMLLRFATTFGPG